MPRFNRIVTIPALALVVAVALAPAEAGRRGDAKQAEADASTAWSVDDPPGARWVTVEIDTTETTWSDVDVSPDGSTVVFDMLGDLYTVPIEGGDATPLTEGVAWDFQPRFSPDGTTIAFVSDRGGADNLWLVDADGSNPRAVTEEKTHLVHNPSWSPDGQYLVAKKGFTSTRSIPAGEIWMFHVGGGDGLQLTDRPNGPRDQKTMAEPAFSIDGRSVFYSQDVTPGLRWEYNKDSTGSIFAIKRLDLESGETDTFVSGAGGAIRPVPSPDGTMLAFVKRTPAFTSALYVKSLDDGVERPVYERLDRDLQETNGSQGNTTAFGWTPDSREIVFWAGGSIRRVDVGTGETREIPVRVRTTRSIQRALRVPVEVAPETFRVRMLRWAQRSPDGARTLFQALGTLHVADAEGGEPRRLTSQTDHFELWPSFSRDGRRVVYTSWNDERLGRVRVVGAEGGAGRIVTPDPGHYVEPRFSPDGATIVYRKIAGGYLLSGAWSQEPGIYVVPAAGGTPRRVSKRGHSPQFGADGERVYFVDAGDDGASVLKSVNLEGHDERTHLTGEKVTELALSPDGRWIAFAEHYTVYVAPFRASGRASSIGSGTTAVPLRQVSKRGGEWLHWSADSRSLHWSHGPRLFTRELRDAFAFLDGAPDELPEPVVDGVDLSFETASDRPSGTIALVGGRVVTMRDAESRQEVIDDGVVVVEGDRILAVGRRDAIEIPADARRFDVSGHTVVPGLIDVHAHGAMARREITPQQNWMQYSNLAFGVTTIHDPSNDTTAIFAASELQRTGKTVAPRIFSTGTILYGAAGPGYHATVESLDDARFHVRRLQDVGAISVKSYQQPRRDQRQQVIAAGRELGVMVVPEGGAKFQHNMTQIVDGHTGIEHAIPLAHAYDDVLQLWAGSETGYSPTFGVAYGGLSGETYWYDRTEVWRNERLMRFVPRFLVEPASMRRTSAPDEHYNHVHVARFAKRLRERGVPVVIGAHGQREGLAAHWEMWMMHQGGFTPWEALRGATIDGARYLGLDGDVGSIEVGKLADLAVIEGDPLGDLRRSELVTYTMIGGRLYETATMNRLAPERDERRPFFFELPGGDTVHPSTTRWLEELQRRHGWVH